MTTLPDYAELHCLSNFTFLRGASHAEELVERAAALGYAALTITDECSLAGIVRAHTAAQAHGLKLIVGSEFRLADGPKLVLLATNREGYGNLSQLITTGRRNADKGAYHLARHDLEDGVPGCLALLLPEYAPTKRLPMATQEASGTAVAEAAGIPPHPSPLTPHQQQHQHARWLARTFPGRAWIAVERHLGADDAAHTAALEQLSHDSDLPLAAAGDVHMHRRGRRALQDLLTAVRLGTTVAAAGHALHPNGERHLRDRAHLAELYEPAWLAETLRIAGRCSFSLDELRYEYPDDMVPAGESPAAYLRRLALDGLRERWPGGAPEHVRRQVEHELAVIAELRYEPYFLTVHDIVRFARGRGILCQGRGSAANSAVCYCLGITAVDPSRMDMLFERFVSKERNEPPDIDVDFEHERREEVIQYIYRRYGRERAALAATVIRYRRRSALRDAGKALGLSPEQVDRLAGAAAWWDKGVAPERLREAGFDPDNPVIRRVLHLAAELHGFPRHLSQHVGGFVIARGPVTRLVPVENAAMAERTIIQWDKDDLDAMGLLKVDCLALGMLSAIRRAFDLIGGRALSLATVPTEDPAVYAMIQRADTTGVFQIESRAQMSMLPRLRPENFYDLVIEVAIVRPGPIQGQMVHPYLKRRQGLEPVTYPSEEVRDVLARTLGVPIFQEQVIKLAMVAAGFSAGEADQLRRAIGSWRRREKLEHFQQRLAEGMRERGYSEQFAQQIYNQIQGFGEYGFPESHAASFALLVYVSAWLKCHHPAAFTCALLNSQPMGFYAPAQLVQDARRHGVEVRPVDVTVSDWDCSLERGEKAKTVATEDTEKNSCLAQRRGGADKAAEECVATDARWHQRRNALGREYVLSPHPSHLTPHQNDVPPHPSPLTPHPALRLGLRMVRGLSRAGAERLVAARRDQPLRSVADLTRRAELSRKDLEALAAAGALAALAGHRHRARWQVLGVEESLPLFTAAEAPEESPSLPRPTEAQDLIADYAGVGLTLGRHPLALLRPRLRQLRSVTAADLGGLHDGARVHLIALVITRQHPASAAGTIFLTLEDETGSANVIVWQRLSETYRREVLAARLLGVHAQLQREGEVIHLVAQRLVDHTALLGELQTRSRDFC